MVETCRTLLMICPDPVQCFAWHILPVAKSATWLVLQLVIDYADLPTGTMDDPE